MMFYYSIIIISFLFAGNAADNCLNVKDISDKYNVNKYTNPYYNDTDKNVSYSFNVFIPEAVENSHIAIVYNRSNLGPYDNILVIVFADCPERRFKCGLLDIGIYGGLFRDSFEYKEQYRQDPADYIEVQKKFIGDKEADTVFIARYQTRGNDPSYRGKYNVFIIPAATKKVDNSCSIKFNEETIYIPFGNYSALDHTTFYKEAKLIDCACNQPKPGIPLLPIIIAIVLVVVVIIVIVMVVLYHRGVFGKRNQHDDAANNEEQGMVLIPGQTDKAKAPIEIEAAVNGMDVEVTWQSGDDNHVANYHLQMKPEDNQSWKDVNATITDTHFTVKNLPENVYYHFRVSAENKVGKSEPSKPSNSVMVGTILAFVRKLSDITINNLPTNAVIECEFNREPKNVAWTKNNKPIPPNKRYNVEALGKIHRITITDMMEKDIGEFEITAEKLKSECSLKVEGGTTATKSTGTGVRA